MSTYFPKKKQKLLRCFLLEAPFWAKPYSDSQDTSMYFKLSMLLRNRQGTWKKMETPNRTSSPQMITSLSEHCERHRFMISNCNKILFPFKEQLAENNPTPFNIPIIKCWASSLACMSSYNMSSTTKVEKKEKAFFLRVLIPLHPNWPLFTVKWVQSPSR